MWDEILKSKARAVQDFSTDDILSALGLQRQRTPVDVAISTSLSFLVGAVAGAGAALLLAPKTGREMRRDISNKASELTRSLSSSASELAEEARQALPTSEERRPSSLAGSNRSTS